jgi:hypothetical protein
VPERRAGDDLAPAGGPPREHTPFLITYRQLGADGRTCVIDEQEVAIG